MRTNPREGGQTTVEYATVIALVVLVLAAALAVGAPGVFNGFWSTVQSAF